VKRDVTPVRAEFLRPREWVERNGIVAGASLPETALIEIGLDHSEDPEPLKACGLAVTGFCSPHGQPAGIDIYSGGYPINLGASISLRPELPSVPYRMPADALPEPLLYGR
jgi:hypothetical protein